MPRNKQKQDSPGEGRQLLGWPGYRTRSNRSGLDPLETENEAAHMEGTFLRNVFTLRARTRNPFYLLLMFLFGVVPFGVSIALALGGLPRPDTSLLVPATYFAVFMLITGAVTINFLLSILELLGTGRSTEITNIQQSRETKHSNKPVRRKDSN